MTSVLRYTAQPKKNPQVYFTVLTPSYYDNTIISGGATNILMPIPFYITPEGILEIAIIDGVQSYLLTPGLSFSGLDNQPAYQAKVMGGFQNVVSLGQTVKDFLLAYVTSAPPNGLNQTTNGDFELIVKPVMTRIQFATNPLQIDASDSIMVSNYEPSSSEFITGKFENNYRSVWAFQSPMTIRYYSTSLNKFQYITFTSSLSWG